jgi:cation diffusion facilitator CzcD-associated flavoprotein CzcO
MLQLRTTFKWAVIGAGPAGIAAVGKLIDSKIPAHDIVWFDPEFTGGDFGTKWRNVSSNTKISRFLKYYRARESFHWDKKPQTYAIEDMDPQETCLLKYANEPLEYITEQLRQQVQSVPIRVDRLKLEHRQWHIAFGENQQVTAKQVILAIGSEPNMLTHDNLKVVSIVDALDPEKLVKKIGPDDTIAVFGSSHSAIIIIRTLLEICNVKKVLNFYRSALCYAIDFDDWILFDDTGLKGKTATWARENIDGVLPEKLVRLYSNEQNLALHLASCNKAIYATGFHARKIAVEGYPKLEYNTHSGIIGPGLFGFGIAFPESKTDRYGTVEYRVGLWKFMCYIDAVMPLWLKYST